MKFAVTTVRNNAYSFMEQAKQWAKTLDVEFISRKNYGKIEDMLADNGLDAVLVASANGAQIVSSEGKFFYHPSMAALRIKKLKNNENDNFASALGLQKGMRILDATLGLASDAAIASYIVGSEGQVVGLEASRLIAFAVQQGLASYQTGDADLDEALRRIKAVHVSAEEYLENCAPDSFDIVYFDPMFRYPVNRSVAMHVMRPLSYDKPLTLQAVKLALKAAPKVVIKERTENILAEYGCSEILGGRYSNVKYGVIRR